MTDERRLQNLIASTAYNPLKFVKIAYPWGEEGSELKDETGPDGWQEQILVDLGRALREKTKKPIRIAAASGHGVGKSALISWLVHWFMSTRPDPSIVVTANTATQLNKKTFREVALWHNRLINKHWHKWTATKYYNVERPETWFAGAIPWSKDNTEAFAGTHAKHVMFLFDEASAIDDVIWNVTEGGLTTDKVIWVAFGNMTRNTGKFRDCFGANAHRWKTYKIDSRQAKKANQELIKEWIEDYGEDSDFVRVRVKGEPPRSGTSQFISSDDVEIAMNRVLPIDHTAIKTLAVDVARFGDDKSVISKRIGRILLPMEKHIGLDTMQLASRVADVIDEFEPDQTFVDGSGLGAGVVDRLRQLNYRVVDVLPGAKPTNPKKYFNKRAEMWGMLRDWLKTEVSLPKDQDLKAALTGVEYGFDPNMAIQLERKVDMKARGLPSPDEGDAAAYHFAEPTRQKDSLYRSMNIHNPQKPWRRNSIDWRAI